VLVMIALGAFLEADDDRINMTEEDEDADAQKETGA